MSRLWPVLVLVGTSWIVPSASMPPGSVGPSGARTMTVSTPPSDAVRCENSGKDGSPKKWACRRFRGGLCLGNGGPICGPTIPQARTP